MLTKGLVMSRHSDGFCFKNLFVVLNEVFINSNFLVGFFFSHIVDLAKNLVSHECHP